MIFNFGVCQWKGPDCKFQISLKVTAVKVALSSGAQNQKVESSIAKPLKDHAFATPEKVAELIEKVNW